MKNSIKRAQSQACLGFAERKNFRPLAKLKKLTMTLALLIMAVTGAWAQSAFNVVEFEVPADWANDNTPLTAADLPGFKTSTLAEAQTWTGAPADGKAMLVYAFDGNTISFVNYNNGKGGGATTSNTKKQVFAFKSSFKFYYTAEITEWSLTPDADKKVWTLAKMPANDVELQVEYFAESNLFLSKEALANKANISVLNGETAVAFDDEGKSTATVTEGNTVTVTYTGKKVLGMTVAKKAAASVPDGAINGKFSVSATKQVYFSKGNLRYASGTWSFFDNQYDYYATYSADAWDKFGWSNSTSNFGMSTSTDNTGYKGDLVDWGTVPGIGTGWFTLSNDEWGYLFNTRSASTVNSVADARYAKGKVNGVYGIILFPDTYTHPAGVTLPVGINEVGNAGWNGNNYSAADWTAMETAGCVFLPATGYREGTSVQSAGSSCSYRSSSRANTESVRYVYFTSSNLNANTTNYGFYGQCVRLVREVTE